MRINTPTINGHMNLLGEKIAAVESISCFLERVPSEAIWLGQFVIQNAYIWKTFIAAYLWVGVRSRMLRPEMRLVPAVTSINVNGFNVLAKTQCCFLRFSQQIDTVFSVYFQMWLVFINLQRNKQHNDKKTTIYDPNFKRAECNNNCKSYLKALHVSQINQSKKRKTIFF